MGKQGVWRDGLGFKGILNRAWGLYRSLNYCRVDPSGFRIETTVEWTTRNPILAINQNPSSRVGNL